MSHDRGWRAACIVTTRSPEFHFAVGEVARGVTAMVVGSGALLGLFFFLGEKLPKSRAIIEVLARWACNQPATIIEQFAFDAKNSHRAINHVFVVQEYSIASLC